MPIQVPAAVPDNLPREGELRVRVGTGARPRAFDHARNHEWQEVIQEAKRLAGEVKQASQLGELEGYLTQRRKEIKLALPFLHDLSEALQAARDHTAIAVPRACPCAGQVQVLYRSLMGQATQPRIVQRLVEAIDGTAIIASVAEVR